MEADVSPLGSGEALSAAEAGVTVRQQRYKTMAGNADPQSMLTDFMDISPDQK